MNFWNIPGGPASFLFYEIGKLFNDKPNFDMEQIFKFVGDDWKPIQLFPPEVGSDEVEDIGRFFPFKNRAHSRALLFDAIKNIYELWMKKDTLLLPDLFGKKLPFILIGGAPGIGKTTFITNAVLGEYEALKKGQGNHLPSSSPVVEMLNNCVCNGLVVSVSLYVESIFAQEETDLRMFFLGRLVYKYLQPKESYLQFLRRFSVCTLTELMDSIVKKFKLKTPTMIVFHVDETNVMEQQFLEKLDRAAASLLYESNYFFVFVQTGVRSTLMKAAANAASGTDVHYLIPLPPLKNRHLIEITQSLLGTNVVNEFLSELIDYCAGNPRYLEFVLTAFARPSSSSNQFVSISKLKESNLMTFNPEDKKKAQILSNIVAIIKKRTRLSNYLEMSESELVELISTELLHQKGMYAAIQLKL
eukprot:TRINITY_DN981_c0_g1_i10.p1 TRINITY_DN981_c0_g1~~TRINITY_DN981_c0_g1_i10.p1  ORF type:complete len:416 (+),score=49.38 TRINITY_DN981_c0_g1_i10:177-1424(+)